MKKIVAVLVTLSLSLAVSSWAKAAEDKKEEHEKEVKLTAVPAAAQATIKKEAGEGTITKVLEGSDTEGGKPTYYEAKYMLGGKKLQVKVAPDGKLISKGDDDE